MASSFKTLTPNDKQSTKTLLHEAIPLTSSLVSGTYNDANIKTYAHGMFVSVYDYPYLSSSANHVFDITCGYSALSTLSKSVGTTQQQEKKINVYNSLAQVLAGFDATGTVQRFDQDGNFADGGAKINQAVFLNFSRLLAKDSVSKGTFSISFYNSGSINAPTHPMTYTDAGAATNYKVNSPAGDYGIIYQDGDSSFGGKGLIYYDAGVLVLTSSIFSASLEHFGDSVGGAGAALDGGSITGSLTGATINSFATAIRNRWANCSFNNTTELNSTIYFCRANNSDFNYSSNPTYLSASQIFVKVEPDDLPTTYFTTVGLYSPDNELLAVAKLSEPIKKTPANELTLRVRLDY